MERIPIAKPSFHGNEKKYLNECIDTGWISSQGKFIQKFEEKFADYCGMKYAVACSNGTVSLHLVLLAMGIGANDEVIMPTLTYIATANSVRYCGGKPVFVDSEPDTYNMDPKQIENRITKNTKAIMPVHLYGLPANMGEICKIANKYDIKVIEDAAEAHGASIEGQKVGSFGYASSFSFFGNKIITCGEGGMVTTNDKDLHERMKLLRSQAVSPKKRYWHDEIGYNYRMTNMQAAVGLAQLEDIEWHKAQVNRVACLYKEKLSKLSDYIQMQHTPKGMEHANWMTTIVLKDSVKKERDSVLCELDEAGIEPRPAFYPMHTMPPYAYSTSEFPYAEKIGLRGLSLPSFAEIKEEEIDYVCKTLERIIK